MPFENIGIGGVLSFDSGRAVTNMGSARTSFLNLRRSADALKMSMGRVSQGIAKFNLVGGAMGAVAGISLGALVKQGIDFNDMMQSSRIAIAGILSETTGRGFDESINIAEASMKRLVKISAEAPGDLRDVLGIFQLMIGPSVTIGANMNQVMDMTKGTAIAAGFLKRNFTDVGAAMSKLAAGQIEMGNDIHRMIKSMGFLPEQTDEWREMLPEKRLQRMQEIIGKFSKYGDQVGNTFDALKGTMQSIKLTILSAFTKGVFERLTKSMIRINDVFTENQARIEGMAMALGDKLGAAFDFVTEQSRIFGRSVRAVFGHITRAVNATNSLLSRFNVTLDKGTVKTLAGIAFQFIAWVALIAPVLAIGGKFIGMISGLFSIVQGVGGALMAISGPLLIITGLAAALFLLFRKEGETPMQTLGRAFDGLISVAATLKEAWKPVLDTLMGAFENVRSAISSASISVDPLRTGLTSLGTGVMTILTGVVPVIQNIIQWVGRIMATITAVANPVIGIVGTVFDLVGSLVSTMFPKVMSILNPIISLVMSVVNSVAAAAGSILKVVGDIVAIAAALIKRYVFPVVGYVIDVLSPALSSVFEAIGLIINTVIDSLKWLFDQMGKVTGWIRSKLTPSLDEANAKAGALTKPAGAAVEATRNKSIAEGAANKALEGQKKVAELAAPPRPEDKQPVIDFNAILKVDNKMQVDGRHVSAASARHKTEISERTGFNQAPWQRQLVQVAGA